MDESPQDTVSATGKNASAVTGLLPSWKGNLAIFGLLILATLAYFYWQTERARTFFHRNVREHTRMLAGVIRLNVDRAVLSHEVVEEILATFLGNAARFVAYLDAVKPFSETELTAFASEAGLSGIAVHRGEGDSSAGPAGWLSPSETSCRDAEGSLKHLPRKRLYTLASTDISGNGCVVVGIRADRIETLHEQVALPHLLESLSGLSGIAFVRVEKGAADRRDAPGPFEIELAAGGEDGKVVLARISMGEDVLAVGFETTPFVARAGQLRNEFFLFAAVLAALGVFFSWLLYKYQESYLKRVREFDRRIARQHEEAALGRAAASIAHEIRNPLNAIGMGLQRLRMEIDSLPPEQEDLIVALLAAVKRTDGIVSGLKRYAAPLNPGSAEILLDDVTDRVLKLYERQCEECGIGVLRGKRCEKPILGDPLLIGEVVENLVKNAVEAQPKGGFARIECGQRDGACVWTIENGGFSLPPDQIDRIFQPYFTGKTRGTGLGLALVERIVKAHGGSVRARAGRDRVFAIELRLPLSRTEPEKP